MAPVKKKSKLSSIARKIKSIAKKVGKLVNKATGVKSYSSVGKEQPKTTTSSGRTEIRMPGDVSVTSQFVPANAKLPNTPGIRWSNNTPFNLDEAKKASTTYSKGITPPTTGVTWTKPRGSGGSGGGTDSDAINKLFESSMSSDLSSITSTSDLGGGFAGGVNTPSGSPTSSNPIDAYSGSQGSWAQAQAEARALEEEQKRLDNLKEEKEEGLNMWKKLMGDQEEAIEDAREDAWDETGINPKEFFAQQEGLAKEIATLNDEYARVQEAKDQQIAQSMDKLASMNFINNQVQQINRAAAPELNRISAQMNARAALMESLRGNFGQAQTYVNAAVDAATADQRFLLDQYREYREINSDYFDGLDSVYKDAYDSAEKRAQDELDYTREEKKQVLEWYVTPEGQRAGVSLDDTVESAAEKFRRAGLTPGGSTSSGNFTPTQVNDGAAAAGLPVSQFKALDADVQNYFVSTSASVISTMMNNIAAINGNPTKAQKVRDIIERAPIAPAVKDYFNSLVDSEVGPAAQEEEQSWWSGVADWFASYRNN